MSFLIKKVAGSLHDSLLYYTYCLKYIRFFFESHNGSCIQWIISIAWQITGSLWALGKQGPSIENFTKVDYE